MKLIRSISREKDKAYFTFKCPTYAEHGKLACTSKATRKADMDEAVFQSIRKQMDVFMESAHIIKRLLAQKQAINTSSSRKKRQMALNTKIKNLRSAIATLYVDMKDGLLTDEEYLLQKGKYQAEIAELEHTLSEMTRDETDTEEQLIGTKRWAAIAEEYSDATELTEGLLNACVKQIKVHSDGSLEIAFNYMEEFKELFETTERLKKEVA